MHEVSTTPSKTERPTAVVALSRSAKWWLAILTVLLVGTWLSFSLHLWLRDTQRPPAHGTEVPAAAAENPPVSLGPEKIIEGPWGRIEIVPITISPPPEFRGRYLQDDSSEVVWHFPNVSSSQLSDVLIQSGLPDSLIVKLKSLARFDGSIGGQTIHPGRELVLGLSPDVRAKLYVFLHQFSENGDQQNGFRFCGSSLEQWFGDVSLLPETKRLVARLVYRQGSYLFFSDLRSVAPALPSAEERESLVRAVTRESTLLLRLKISQTSNVEALVKYWGRGGREKEVRPILESLSQLPGESNLDVTQLLPPLARQRIYTYPTVAGATAPSVSRDSHWTSMNFFSEEPDDRYGDAATSFDTFGKDYYRIYGNLRLGDLVLYVDEKSRPVHSAVYIAADIVFTKNGSSAARPWMFLKLQDMDDYYPRRKPLSRGLFRRRGT